jgi:solute carrier family 25 (mitochondrial adenine nucleotide translocator), member 4/5/6/31
MKLSETSERQRKIPKWQDALAGAVSGAISKTAMAPVERVKLLMQLQGSVQGMSGKSPLGVASHVYKSEGFIAFWRGNWPNVLRTAGQAGLNFSFMDFFKSIASSDTVEAVMLQHRHTNNENVKRRRQLATSFVAGGLAGATSTTVLYPTEYLRTRLAMDQGSSLQMREYRSMSDVIVKTVRTDGVLGLYQGFGIAVWGSILYRLLYLGGYDGIKREYIRYKEGCGSTMTFGERFIIAQSVALVAGTICYPIDSVRRRLMMQAGKPLDERLYFGSIHCFRVVWSKEGLRGFYLGLTPNLVRSIGGALMLVVYDGIKIMT